MPAIAFLLLWPLIEIGLFVTLGAALVIALGQLPNLLGISVASQATALATLLNIGEHLLESDWRSLAVALK